MEKHIFSTDYHCNKSYNTCKKDNNTYSYLHGTRCYPSLSTCPLRTKTIGTVGTSLIIEKIVDEVSSYLHQTSEEQTANPQHHMHHRCGKQSSPVEHVGLSESTYTKRQCTCK